LAQRIVRDVCCPPAVLSGHGRETRRTVILDVLFHASSPPPAIPMSDDSRDENAGLFRRDDPEPAELAIVLGHSDPSVAGRRAEHAARLFLRGLVPTLLLSGGRTTTPESEAELMAKACVRAGVPRDRLLMEEKSRTTFENAAR